MSKYNDAAIMLVDEFLESAYECHYDRVTDEYVRVCRLCDKEGGHDDTCPIPAVEQWLTT